jgi:hypothetical protein
MVKKPKAIDLSPVQAAFIAERGGVMTVFTGSTVFG